MTLNEKTGADTMTTPLFKVQNSPIAGVGCFAIVPILKGKMVHPMDGTLVHFDKLLTLVQDGSEHPSDPLQVGIDLYIDLDEVSRSFNHSCDSNVFVRGMGDLVALRDIGVGEEITYDYSTTMLYDLERIRANGHEPWTCTCLCGAANCRGIIDQFPTLPEKVKTHYLENSLAPDYILRLFS